MRCGGRLSRAGLGAYWTNASLGAGFCPVGGERKVETERRSEPGIWLLPFRVLTFSHPLSKALIFPFQPAIFLLYVQRNMPTLTTRQQEVLDFIDDCQTRTGVIPTTREIQQHFGFASQTAAVNHLRALEKKGVIQRQAGKARAVAIASHLEREQIVDVPIYGQIAAGMAETVEQENDGVLSIDAASVGVSKGQKAFALKVRGDSMIDAGIDHGDLVILEHRSPRPGNVVAALIDGETTLKRYLHEGGRPYLKAENPLYPDLLPARELIVQGVMVALIRKFRN
jgi:repressor LexA